MTPATAGGPYRLPKEPSRGRSMALAAAVHAGLLLFLWIGTNWQTTPDVAVEAEVWDMSVQQAAPPPPPPVAEPEVQPEPEPTPPPKVEQPVAQTPPDIALERERKRKEEQKRAEELAKQEKLEKERQRAEELAQQKLEEKKLKAEEAKKEKARLAAEEKARAKARADEIRRMHEAASGTGTAARSTGPKSDPGYIASLTAKIKGNIIYGGSRDVPGDPRAVYRIEQLPTGEIIGFKKIKSSGIPEYDRAVEQAITASSPLPKKKDGTVERTIEPIFRLKE